MQIKQHGLKYQILVPYYDPKAKRRANKVVGRVEMSVSDPDEVIRLLAPQLAEAQRKFAVAGQESDLPLSDQEMGKIRDFFVRREHGRKNFLRGKFPRDSPSTIESAAKSLSSNDNDLPTEPQLLSAFQTISKAMVSDHYVSEMFEACAVAAEEGIRLNELPEQDALQIIRAWISVKKALEQQGYTAAWYKRRREDKRDLNE